MRVIKSGGRFGRLTVRGKNPLYKGGRKFWECECSCFRKSRKYIREDSLKVGTTKSCGCLVRERMTTHGNSSHPLYNTYQLMLRRCYNKKSTKYANYGGRGIKVCKSWRSSFKAFCTDMGIKPLGTSIERTNNQLGYDAENCIWGTAIEQANNRRSNTLHTVEGVTKTLSEWASLKGLKYNVVMRRVHDGWSVEKALNTPILPVGISERSYISNKGETKSRVEWSLLLGGKENMVSVRIARGWKEEDAVSVRAGARRKGVKQRE